MGNVGNVGFFEKYSSVSFFKKFGNKCFLSSDVKKMADEYEANINKIILDNEKEVKLLKDNFKKEIDNLKEINEELHTNAKEMSELHNRASASKESIIDKLNVAIENLKSELKNKDKDCEKIIDDIKRENSSKLNKIKTECADALLKADSKNNKTKKPAEEPVEEVTPIVAPELPTLEEEVIDEKKQKARSGTKSLSLEQIVSVKKRKDNGERVIDIAKDLGVHKSTINRALKK